MDTGRIRSRKCSTFSNTFCSRLVSCHHSRTTKIHSTSMFSSLPSIIDRSDFSSRVGRNSTNFLKLIFAQATKSFIDYVNVLDDNVNSSAFHHFYVASFVILQQVAKFNGITFMVYLIKLSMVVELTILSIQMFYVLILCNISTRQ